MIGFGDIAALAAQPIAYAVDVALGTDLRNCGSCKERKERWNNFSENIFNNKQGDNMADENKKVEYLLQVSVLATDLKDALSQVSGGKITAGAPAPTTRMIMHPSPPPLAPVQNLKPKSTG